MTPARSISWFILAAFLAPAAAVGQNGDQPASVVVDDARMEMVEPRREVTGELRAVRRSELATEEPGLVVESLVDEGDAVEAGQTLARLDDTRLALDVRRFEASVRSAEAVVERRQAQVEQARRDLDRLKSLQERASASQNEVDDARTTLAERLAEDQEARANLERAKADLELARERLADMTIRAPFAGRIVQIAAEAGEWVREGDAIVEIIEIDPLEAWLDVPERFIGRLEFEAAQAQVRIRATGEVRSAAIASVIPQADELSRLIPVRTHLHNPDGELKPGMSIVGLVPTGLRDTMLTVHKDAILRDDAGTYVYFAAGGRAAVARVEPLFAVADRVVVRSERLSAGAKVVIEGNERLFPGQPIRIVGGDGGGEGGSAAAEVQPSDEGA